MNQKRKAIFLDRDGTINEEAGYITHPSQVRVYDFAIEAIRMINQADFLAIVTTNQAGIARGVFTEDFLSEIHLLINDTLLRGGARLDAIYFCPHHPHDGFPPYRIECDCRKPLPGMLLRAAEDFNIDLTASYMIGDRYRDIQAGHSAGSRSILVRTGYGEEELTVESGNWPRNPDYVASNLLDATQWILHEDPHSS
ncbi:MAG: D-glycero-beta-D-manno-heptose 1,7-bisphosphate 7-phosphatase [Acidobacteriota bacterium]|nr:MAG: D-glycero-beta-D-manno-heptose 1,7-bisphosphate 7-phosphatase [Acidobacteriota bacterium]